ncbi:MAG: TonB-dependent receptor [Burkholderiaceae bacterium]|nr:TonB-dependent receptor [Burkholderiaceae bacterium]
MKNRMTSPSRLGSPIQLAVLALLAGATSAHAQQAQAPATPAAQQAAAASDSTVVPEIVVTATKRTTPLQKTPLAITALSAATLQDNHVQNIEDIVTLVPGFQATTQVDHGVITMTLRGIGNDQAKTEQADPEVAIFVDGVYAPRAEGATALLFDLEGMEVLRGPQGTLWGRNSTVGAVNMQTAKPIIGDNSYSFETGAGSYNAVGAKGAFNIPLSDTMAMRVAFDHEQHDGYVNFQTPPNISIASQQAAYFAANPTASAASFQPINSNDFVTRGQKYDAQDQTAVRLSYLWQPSANLKWNVSLEAFRDRGTPNENLMQDPRPGQDLWSALIMQAPSLDRDTRNVRSRVDWAVNDNMALNYTFGYGLYNGSSTFDQNAGANVPTSFATGGNTQFDNTDNSHYENYSHEVQLQSTGKHQLDWLLGAYYGHESNSIRFDIPQQVGTTQGPINWMGVFIQPDETVTSKAVFTQETWNVSDTVHLTAGVRLTKDEKANNGGNDYAWTYDPTLPNQPVQPSGNINVNLNNGVPIGQPGSGLKSYDLNTGTYSDSKATWLLKGAFDIDANNMVYASVSTGFKSGGLQDGGASVGAAGVFAPETITSYEVGTKSSFLGGQIKWNNALYDEEFKDYQFASAVTLPGGGHTLNLYNVGGITRIVGLESELAARLTKDDKLQLTASYIPTATLGSMVAGSNDYSQIMPANPATGVNSESVTGNRMPHAPKFSSTLQYQHVFHVGDARLTPRINMHYETASWLSVFDGGVATANNVANNTHDEQKAYTRTDLGLRYDSNKSWYVDAWIRNVENANIKTAALAQQSSNGVVVWQAQYLPPLTAGINFGIRY